MLTRHHLSFLITMACGLCSIAAQSKISLDRPQKIDDWGYSIRTLKEWDSMAIKPEEKYVVGHWKLNTDKLRLRGLYDLYRAGSYCDLRVFRIANAPVTGQSKSDEDKKKEKELQDKIRRDPKLARLLKPKSFEDYLLGRFDNADKRWTREPFKAGKLEGELIEFGAGAESFTIAYFKQAGVDWGVIYTAFEEDSSRYKKYYLRSLKSFKLFEAANTNMIAAASKNPNKLEGDAKREYFHASIAGNPGWWAHDTDHYVFLTNSEDKRFIISLARQMEIARAKVYTKHFPARNETQPISPVRVLETQSDYHKYGGPYGSAGYFSPRTGELVLFTQFEGVTKTNSKDYCRSVMFHEGFHQYIHYAVGDVSPHSWFNEGHGDFFAGMKVAGSRVRFGLFDWRVDFLKRHMREDKDLIPLRTLVRLPQREYYTNAGLKYSQGWAFIYYLRNVTRDKKAKLILDTYFDYLADNIEAFRQKKKKKDEDGDEVGGESVPGIPGVRIVNFEDSNKVEQILSKAVDEAFKGVDFEKLDRDFQRWVKKL